MNTRRILFWLGFAIALVLIVWGLIAAMNKPAHSDGQNLSEPAPVTAADHVRGPADAPVTMIEYSDFQCPACEAYYPVVEKLLASSSVPIRMIYRHFPLPQHPNAIPAALVAEAAADQGKFWDMYHLLFANHADWTPLSDPTPVFTGYATTLGLDMARFKADLSSSTLRDRIQANEDEGIKIGINATPTFFINGRAVSNPQSYAEFQTLIQQAASGGTR